MARRVLGKATEVLMPNQYGSDLTNKNMDQRVGELKENVRGLVEQGQDKVNELKTKVVEVKDQAMQRGGALLDSVRDNIKMHPLTSIGIAFGVGYFAMRIFRH